MYVNKIKIGNIELENNIFLAPMAGITDRAFRSICKEYGAGLTYSEMISAKGLYYNDEKTYKLAKKSDDEKIYAIQLFGNDPYIISEAIKKIEDMCDIIDINMGCPAPKVANHNDGSALMKDPKLVARIVESAVNATNKPITVKIRKGWDDNLVNAVEISKIAQDNGAKAIAIHGRTRMQFYTGKADWDIIKKVKESVDIPVIANGDIVDYSSFKEAIEYTKADGVMIARGSLGNPWIFKSILDYDRNNVEYNMTNEEKLDTILKHYRKEIEEKGEYTAVREMRKHICWYVKGMSNSSYIKDTINKMEIADEVIQILQKYFKNEM